MSTVLHTFLHRLRELAVRFIVTLMVLLISVAILKYTGLIWLAYVPWAAFIVYVVIDLVQKIRQAHRDIT